MVEEGRERAGERQGKSIRMGGEVRSRGREGEEEKNG
jgi:hypothetical protein